VKKGYFTPARIVFWLVMMSLLAISIFCWVSFLIPPQHRGSDRAYCIMNQRNLQALMRHVQEEEHLKPGDPIEWAKLIGPGLLMESRPVCPVHGEYTISPLVTEPGILVAPCRDAGHQPEKISDW